MKLARSTKLYQANLMILFDSLSCRLSLLSVLLLITLTSCVTVGTQRGGEQGLIATTSLSSSQPQVSLCLISSGGDQNYQVRVDMEAIEVSAGGQWVSLLSQPLTLTSKQASRGALLDRVQAPVGQYQRVRFRITQVVVEQDGRETTLLPPSQPVEYPLAKVVSLEEGDSVTLFLHWDIAASVIKAPQFIPAFGVSEQHIPLTTELAFVSCPEINTVYIIRTDQNRICGSWGIFGAPTSLHASKAGNILYVLAEDQATIVAVELSSGKVRDRIRIPMATRPSLMTIDSAGRNAYLVDQATGMVFRVDLDTGSLAAQIRLGDRLDYCVFLEESQIVAVSSSQSQKVVLLDPMTLQVRQSIAVGTNPEGIAEYDGNLYIAESRANTVGMYSMGSGASLRQHVGLGPSRILFHERSLFVANSQGGSVSVLRPDQLTVVKEIATGGSPGEMAISFARNWLYAVDGSANLVTVIDLSTQKLESEIDLRAKPFDIVVIQ